MTPQVKERIEQIRRGEVPEGYKKTKVGIVPNEWVETKFSDLFVSTSEFTDDLEKYPLYSLTIEEGITAKTERYERSHLVKKDNAYKIVCPNDFAYNPMNVRFGAVARHKGTNKVSVSGYYDIFTTRLTSDLSFMDSFLISNKMIAYYNKVSIGSLIEKQRVHFSQFMDFCLPIPSEDERQKIAEILSEQNKLIALAEKLIEEKKRQKKALMQQLLTTGCENVSQLGKIASITMGQSPDSSSYNERQVGVPLIQGNADINNRLPNPRMYTYTPTKMCNSGDILLSVRAPVGTVARSNVLACIGRGICAINAGELTDYIYQYLLYFENKWRSVAQGSTFEAVSGTDIAKLSIPLYKNQIEIQKFLCTADKEIELLQKELEQEKQKKKALMQLLLTGIVRVSVCAN